MSQTENARLKQNSKKYIVVILTHEIMKLHVFNTTHNLYNNSIKSSSVKWKFYAFNMAIRAKFILMPSIMTTVCLVSEHISNTLNDKYKNVIYRIKFVHTNMQIKPYREVYNFCKSVTCKY